MRTAEPVTVDFDSGTIQCPEDGRFRTDGEMCWHAREVLSLREQGAGDVRFYPSSPDERVEARS